MRKSLVCNSILVCLVIFPGDNFFSQEASVQQIVKTIQSRIVDRDSTLSDYTVKMDITMRNYKKDPPEIEFSEQQQRTYRDGKPVEIQGTGEFTTNSSDSTDSDSSENSQEMRMGMTDPLSVFKSPEEYTFSLGNSPEDSLLVLEVTPNSPTQETYKGTFTLRKSGWSLLRANLTPGAEIPHVKSMETSAVFTEFEGFPVSKSLRSRFQGKYLLVFTFNMGFEIEMEYANID